MGTLEGFSNPPALWLGRAKPGFAHAIMGTLGELASPGEFASPYGNPQRFDFMPDDRHSGGAMRRAEIKRNTKETQIAVTVDLDGKGQTEIDTPMPFFGHMLDAFGRHSLIDLKIDARGDVQVDGHHTVEDTGICLGQAIHQALGDRRGISRFGDATIPMDEAMARVAVDFGGRAAFVYQASALKGRRVGSFDAELAREFFAGFASSALCNLHMEVNYGENAHHILEALFKAFARALRSALAIDPREASVPSTKGTLTA